MRARTPAVAALALALLAGGCSSPAPPRGDGEADRKTAFREDCYEAVQLDAEPPPPERAVFVLVDQTTGLDGGLRETVADNVEKLLGPGTLFSIATFSARNKGRYATILAEGRLQAPPAEELRPDLPVNRLERLDACLVQQSKGMKKEAARQAAEATDVKASTFTHSEILASLTQLSEAVRASEARDKLVILVSDLLEHSPVTTFYSDKELRMLDPAAELEKAKEAGLVGDFGGARIAVVGAGLASAESGAEGIRNTQALAALRRFWERWIEESGGELAQYGEPDLVRPLGWKKERGAPANADDEA
jgi:hypothetical protein